mmetsp:Transcript_10837/g.22263  ORF Transcript_10837/g.22263 Transcript_10837/m.22263 type:complete len:244 (-) Transcript_10837:54-785(-)
MRLQKSRLKRNMKFLPLAFITIWKWILYLRGLGFEVGNHGAGVSNFKRIRVTVLGDASSFDKQFFHLHVINDSGISPRALTESTILFPNARHAHATREQSGSIGNELHLGKSKASDGLIFSKALAKSPLTHDEGVIDGDAVHFVNSHGLDFVISSLISRKMGGRASGSESSGQGEDCNALSLEEVFGSQIFPVKWILISRFNTRTSLEGHRGDGGALFDGCGPFGLGRKRVFGHNILGRVDKL